MKVSHTKKIEKAANIIREVFDDLETEGKEDFDNYGERLENLAAEIDEILEEIETAKAEEDVDDGFQVE